jgi:oxygen-independent coproporphyrinogen-3 oxidase
MLDLDDQCQLSSSIAGGAAVLPEDELVSDLYLETIDYLSSLGCRQYEISNFARQGFACRHNLKYWTREPFYGFGLGSHSFSGSARRANWSDMEQYLAAVENGHSATGWTEIVDVRHALSEELFLGLRLTNGVDWHRLEADFGRDPLTGYRDALVDLSHRGCVEWVNGVVRLTPSGMLISNEIFQLFV